MSRISRASLAAFVRTDASVSMAEKLCADDPQVAAQVMLILAAWIPVTDTPDDRMTRAQLLAGYRLSENLPTLVIPGAA